MEDIAIYGAGGFGREVACLIQAVNKKEPKWNLIGFFDDGLSEGAFNSYGKILGGIEKLNNWKEPVSVIMAIGNPSVLEKVVNNIKNCNIKFPNIIAPDVLVYDPETLSLGKGNLIGFRSVISCNTKLGDFNLLNTDVLIGHDSSIGNFNIFSPSVRISGAVTIGNKNFFGVCSIVLQKKNIGNNTTIATNSVIMRNTKDNLMYMGNPALKIQF